MQNNSSEIVALYAENISPKVLMKDVNGYTALTHGLMNGHSHLAETIVEALIKSYEGEDDPETIRNMLLHACGPEFSDFSHLFRPCHLSKIKDLTYVHQRIFDNLEDHDLYQLRQTNSTWLENLNDPYYWLKRCRWIEDDIDWDCLTRSLQSKFDDVKFDDYKLEITKVLMKLHHVIESSNGNQFLHGGFKPPRVIEILAKEGFNLASKIILQNQLFNQSIFY